MSKKDQELIEQEEEESGDDDDMGKYMIESDEEKSDQKTENEKSDELPAKKRQESNLDPERSVAPTSLADVSENYKLI